MSPWNFNSYVEACDFYGANSILELEADRVAYQVEFQAELTEDAAIESIHADNRFYGDDCIPF